MSEKITLWPHQEEAVKRALDAARAGRGAGLWVMPTGTGKTLAFATLAREMDARTLVVVHRAELVTQTTSAMNRVWSGAAVGVVQGRSNDWSGQVTVATIQSASGRLKAVPPNNFGLVI